MNFKLFLVFLLLPVCVFAQERVTVRGRIINEKGVAFRYEPLSLHGKVPSGTS